MPRPPRTAAVTLTVQQGGEMSYEDAMLLAKRKFPLEGTGIQEIRARRGITGCIILEVPGPDGQKQAETLSQGLQGVFKDTGVSVARPTRTAELRVRGLVESTTPDEVAAAVARIGGCQESEVRVGEIRFPPRGMGSAWVRCPVVAARKVVLAGKLRVGWVMTQIDLLPPRPLQCFKCLERGHTRAQCRSEEDRSGRCYRCGGDGHLLKNCVAAPKCALCADRGKPADHRMGGPACHPPPAKRRRRKATEQPGTVPSDTPSATAEQPRNEGLEEPMVTA